MRAIIAAKTLEAVVAAARAALPDECCGLLVGDRPADDCWRIAAAHPTANVAPPPRHDRFEVDPAAHLRLQRSLRGSGLSVVGHYHSHPTGKPQPSAVDWADVLDRSLIWLIAAPHGGDMTVTAYAVGQAGFIPVALEVNID